MGKKNSGLDGEFADNEMILQALKTVTKNTFKFFHGKGFREYDENLGTWRLVSDREEALKIVCHVIRQTPNLRDDRRINQASIYSSFLHWYQLAEAVTPQDDSNYLLGFQNGTLNLRTMVLEKKDLNNYCFQAVNSVFKFGSTREVQLIFSFL